MALLQKLKEKLGFGSGSSERESGETEVTVERESDPAAEAPEEGGEPTDEAGSAAAVADEDAPEENGEPAAAETEAAASTESLVDEEAAASDAETAAEPAEAATAEDEETDIDDADDRGPSVEEITGIGPAYAERLAEIGIETVGDLADADAAAVAEGTSVGEKRAATWIDRASEF